MCGIIGIIGQQDAAPRLLDGLKRLEYRGYDSAGIATVAYDGTIDRRRAEGKLENLGALLDKNPLAGKTGIGHTRWATHGRPTTNNAHPHASDKVAVVHNGIIENYQSLKEELIAKGQPFETETDTEIVVRLISHYIEEGQKPEEAAFNAIDRLRGAFALCILFAAEENLMIGVRNGTPLAVGYGEGEMFMASDSYALAPLTRQICFLEDGDRVVMRATGVKITDADGSDVDRPVRMTAQSGAATGKGEFAHFMLKEIYEQPAVIGDTLNSFINPSTSAISLPEDVLKMFHNVPRVTMIACGTAYYACMVAKYWFEQILRVPCEIDIASEFRYREAPMPEGGVAIFVSQSGETLDTLEALRYCRRQKQNILSIVNTIESTIERESDYVLRTLAGPEIGVASTKAFTTQLTTLACLVLSLSEKQQVEGSEGDRVAALRELPGETTRILNFDEEIRDIARLIFKARDILYIGRGTLYPIALEGALKLKEISYIHAEGYAAGEMKHGPIALIDEAVPIIVVAPSNDPLFEKTLSNVQETAARGGRIIAFSDAKGIEAMKDMVEAAVTFGTVPTFTAPLLYSLPMQLLAYHVAVLKGTDVDQPRNLAKSVTVE